MRLDGAEIVVLDEADRMLDMGFIRDVRRIIALLPKQRQTLLFSATMPSDIAGLANSILHDPIRVSVSPEKPAVELIDQKVAFVSKAEKCGYLAALIREQGAERAIVFTRTKHGADKLARSLSSSGIPAEAIHANKSQNNRTRTMEGFRAGNLRVLVATDLAARGIDVDGISHVYNYELPEVAETYVHRIGRTARAGAKGSAVALCDSEEKPLLKAIEKLIRQSVPVGSGSAFDIAAEEGRKGAKEAAAAKALRPAGSDRDSGRREQAYASRGRPGRRPEGARQSGARDDRPRAADPRKDASRPAPRAEGRRAEAQRAAAPRSDRPRPSRRPESPRSSAPKSSGGFSIDDVTGFSSRVGSPSRRGR